MEEVGAPIRQSCEALIESTIARNEKYMQDEVHEAEADYANAWTITLEVSLVTILLGLAIGTYVLRSLNKSIGGIIEDLAMASEQVTSASQQIASASVNLSESATEQASALEETVATIEELTSMVKMNSDNAGHAAKISEDTSQVVARGEAEMGVLISAMKEISQDSKKISEIISVIDDIAFQTNLLALNAAVEAARAGEQGKGFAVVAEAVRSLAQRSAIAAKDITDLIRSSVGRMESGGAQVEKSGAVFNEILASVTKVTHLNQEISSASSEQANGIAQISQAMNQMDQVTQVNAASSEEAAASAEELSAQAQSMTSVIHELVRVIRGQAKATNAKEASWQRPSRVKVSRAA
ncbi:MAG: chemotaxis protein [Bdellovibrio sp.]|nr:chemotaxis protein [Bdellovibrio sp.]